MKLPGEEKILWENPNPNVGFGIQNITLSSDNYNELEIFYKDELGRKIMQKSKNFKGVWNSVQSFL